MRCASHRILASVSRIVRSIWRWIKSDDPFSTIADSLIPHRALLGWLAVLTFATMLFFDVTRVAVLVTLWGVLGAGLLVSLILEQHGEVRQRTNWLQRNAEHVRPLLEQILMSAGLVVSFAVGLPNDISTQLRFGKTMEERRSASSRARAAIQAFGEGELTLNPRAFADHAQFSTTVQQSRRWIGEFVGQYSSLLSRLTELQGTLNQFSMATMIVGVAHQPGAAREEIEAFERTQRTVASNAALDLCELCSTLQHEAGLVP